MSQRGKTVEVKCKNCGEMFTARIADRKRGWGKFCSKSCKAKKQEKRTGQCKAYFERQERNDEDEDWLGHPFEAGYFGHGQN